MCTHSISTVGRHVVIVGRISKLDSVLTGFGLTAQGTFSVRERDRDRHEVTHVQLQINKTNYTGLTLGSEEGVKEGRRGTAVKHLSRFVSSASL